MKDKFFTWVGRNRNAIGYGIGGLNLLMALSYLAQGAWGLAILWAVIGVFIIIDIRKPF